MEKCREGQKELLCVSVGESYDRRGELEYCMKKYVRVVWDIYDNSGEVMRNRWVKGCGGITPT